MIFILPPTPLTSAFPVVGPRTPRTDGRRTDDQLRNDPWIAQCLPEIALRYTIGNERDKDLHQTKKLALFMRLRAGTIKPLRMMNTKSRWEWREVKGMADIKYPVPTEGATRGFNLREYENIKPVVSGLAEMLSCPTTA